MLGTLVTMPDRTVRRIDSSTDHPTDGNAIGHVAALDAVRGIAILLVLFLHFGVGADFPNHGAGRVGAWAERIFYVGWSGVDLFFVLSGFLITSILLATKSDPRYFRRFYGRRVLRILPLYYVALLLGIIVLPYVAVGALPPSVLAHHGQVWLWTYTFNLALVFGWANAPLLGHFWTLAIEEQYYVFWPWVVRRLTRDMLLCICVTLIAGSLVLRIGWLMAGWDWQGAYHFTLCRLDGFGVGGMIALLILDPRARTWLERRAPLGLALTGAALIVMFLSVPRFYPTEWRVVTFGQSLLALASGWLVIFALRPGAPRWLQWAWLRSLGKYSYGIYVWHWFLQQTMLAHAPAATKGMSGIRSAVTFLVIGIASSLVVGVFSYWIIEAPFLRLKRIFAYTDRHSVNGRHHDADRVRCKPPAMNTAAQ